MGGVLFFVYKDILRWLSKCVALYRNHRRVFVRKLGKYAQRTT